jgi:hypothetical protein
MEEEGITRNKINEHQMNKIQQKIKEKNGNEKLKNLNQIMSSV